MRFLMVTQGYGLFHLISSTWLPRSWWKEKVHGWPLRAWWPGLEVACITSNYFLLARTQSDCPNLTAEKAEQHDLLVCKRRKEGTVSIWPFPATLLWQSSDVKLWTTSALALLTTFPFCCCCCVFLLHSPYFWQAVCIHLLMLVLPHKNISSTRLGIFVYFVHWPRRAPGTHIS